MAEGISVRIRTKNRAGKTISHFTSGVRCQPCGGSGFTASPLAGTFDTCRQCKGRGLMVLDEKPLPQIEDW